MKRNLCCWITMSTLLVGGLLAGCAGDEAESPATEAIGDTMGGDSAVSPEDSGSTFDPNDPLSAFPPMESMLCVIDTIMFAAETEPGVSPGFNLDEKVSDGSDMESCGGVDFTDPDGTPGIDNQAALLVPVFDLVGFGAVSSFIQGAVEEGGFLLLWQIDGIDNLFHDDEVTVRMRFGSGVPLLGTDGRIVAGQTYHLHGDSPDQQVPNARITGGVLEAGPYDTFLPIDVFGVHYELDVRGAYLRGRLTYDGGIEDGILGGAVTYDSLLELAAKADNEAGGIYDRVVLITDGLGDMMPDENGECQAMSASLAYSAVPAFFYPGEGE
jgi:hypothetical protein